MIATMKNSGCCSACLAQATEWSPTKHPHSSRGLIMPHHRHQNTPVWLRSSTEELFSASKYHHKTSLNAHLGIAINYDLELSLFALLQLQEASPVSSHLCRLVFIDLLWLLISWVSSCHSHISVLYPVSGSLRLNGSSSSNFLLLLLLSS